MVLRKTLFDMNTPVTSTSSQSVATADPRQHISLETIGNDAGSVLRPRRAALRLYVTKKQLLVSGRF